MKDSSMADDDHVLKRKRTDGDQQQLAQRDDEFYFEDGSCIVLVQDILFNVHRSLLARDNSSFATLFSLPQGPLPPQGRSDDNPIVLYGDKASEFRNFLWALYALPPELQIVNSSTVDLNRLIDIARLSNKYSFKSLETWALDAVQDYVNRRPAFSVPNTTAEPLNSNPTQTHLALIENTDQLTRLIQLAQLCNHDRLLASMIALLRQLMTRSLQYAYLSMALADDLDLRSLRGAAYLEVMQRSTSFASLAKEPTANENSEDPSTISITPAQQVRLLSGYWHLTQTWEKKFRTTPPLFTHAPSCSNTWHQPVCEQAWAEFWRDRTRGDAVMSLGLADVIGRLKQIQKDFDRSGPTYVDCKLNARRSLVECIRNVEEKLPDYFSEEGVEE
ncbi:hypothetical protein D9757_007036 [Collybiopsis confluens]|uniref:BTB domain-containing protein n=1 Tax=Collybiopsis confluens TaxID=2823264 RepID=A0A8H5M4S1_9AGAR|nr:hypothetical protein D9757_007036 [Collybiopsis confluens]